MVESNKIDGNNRLDWFLEHIVPKIMMFGVIISPPLIILVAKLFSDLPG